MINDIDKVANRYNTGRSISDILANPVLGETVPAKSLGKSGRNRRVWWVCPTCSQARWVANKPRYRGILHCRSCIRKLVDCRKYKPDAQNVLRRTVQPTTIPKIGNVIRGADIGKAKNKIYIWLACPDCSEHPHWVMRRNPPKGALCPECLNKPTHKSSGEKSGAWKGGRRVDPEGYILVRVLSDNPFYSMSQRGAIREHRLVMAQQLKRCIHSWEVVHHKHTRFPSGSLADKQDNRPENLELIQTPLRHNAITLLEKKATYLMDQVETMRVELRLQKWQTKELLEQVRVLSDILKGVGAS